MSSFYDVIIQGTNKYDKPIGGIPKLTLEYYEQEVFFEYGSFLDDVPHEHKEEVAGHIIKIMYKYNRNMNKYNLHDERNEKLVKQGLKPKERKKNEKRNKIKADLKIADKFRETLESYEEMIERKGLSSLSNKEIDILNDNLDPYYKMVSLIDDYIFDLELEFFDMAKEDNYIDSYLKPNRKELREYLLEVCKLFCIKNCVNNAKKLVVKLSTKTKEDD